MNHEATSLTPIVSPVKELVRLKFVQGGGDWMRLLLQMPVWLAQA